MTDKKRQPRILGAAETADKLAAILATVDERMQSARDVANLDTINTIQSEIFRLVARCDEAGRGKLEALLDALGADLGLFEIEEPTTDDDLVEMTEPSNSEDRARELLVPAAALVEHAPLDAEKLRGTQPYVPGEVAKAALGRR